MPVTLGPILNHLPAWLLVLFRITGIFVIGPVFGSRVIPMRIKVLLAFGLSLCVYPMLLDPSRPSAQWVGQFVLPHPAADLSQLSLFSIGATVFMELMVGAVIGFGTILPIIGMQIGGRIASQQVGLGLAELFAPNVEESGILSQAMFMLAIMIFLILGGHRVMMQTLLATFDRVPLGGLNFQGSIVDLMVALLGSMFELALRVAAPLLCLIFLQTIALGFIARTVPQMNILTIGFPLRILIGMSILIAFVSVLDDVFITQMRKALAMIASVFGA